MKKRIISLLTAIFIIFGACVGLCADAEQVHAFRVAVVIDGEDIAGFAKGEGRLRSFFKTLMLNRENGVTVYFDVENTENSEDLASCLLYLAVKDVRFGVFSDSASAASRFLDIAKYVTKSVERLAITEKKEEFTALGYSVAGEFDMVFDDIGDISLSAKSGGDTAVMMILSEKTLADFSTLAAFASENGMAILATNEKAF